MRLDSGVDRQPTAVQLPGFEPSSSSSLLSQQALARDPVLARTFDPADTVLLQTTAFVAGQISEPSETSTASSSVTSMQLESESDLEARALRVVLHQQRGLLQVTSDQARLPPLPLVDKVSFSQTDPRVNAASGGERVLMQPAGRASELEERAWEEAICARITQELVARQNAASALDSGLIGVIIENF